MKTGTFTALDLRLMFSRQPGLMILLAALVVLIVVILCSPVAGKTGHHRASYRPGAHCRGPA